MVTTFTKGVVVVAYWSYSFSEEGRNVTYTYRWCQNYRTKLGVQKYSKIPYLRTPPDPDSARIRILFYN